MSYIIGYYLGSFLVVWGIYCLVTFRKVRAIEDVVAKKEYRKQRLINSLIIAVVVALITYFAGN